ncbi:MAG: hypothetical protein EXR65_05045 [Dehalococcoidia bacterium]|nr:hypothetical protein [Dehalococcoidia bacterium]
MTANPLSRADRGTIAAILSEHLQAPVALEVWLRQESALLRTDRDRCVHCSETLALARHVAALHPGLSVTRYDLDQHEQRAREAGIERAPTTVLRAGGRSVRFAGLWTGALLPAFLDGVLFVAAGKTPLTDQTRAALASLPADAPPFSIEALVAPYDGYSPGLMRMVFALGAESQRLRVQVTEVAEFPLLAAMRGVARLPVVIIGGRRYEGAWEEGELVEQLRRIATGDEAPVIRPRLPSTPFMTDEQLAAASGEREQPRTPGGLLLPGR